MILLLYFLYLQIDIETNASVNMHYSYPISNLFFINPGFANPSVSRGLLGFSLNPAGLLHAQDSELMITFAPTMKTKIATEFAIPFDSLAAIIDTVKIPAMLGVNQKGGVDFLGALFNIGGWRLGFGYQKGDYLGLDFFADAKATAEFEFSYNDTLTHSDIEEIPVDDTIPVRINLRGAGNLFLVGNGNGGFKSNSFIIALAHKFLGLDMGLGFQIIPVTLSGNFTSLFSGKLIGGAQLSVEPTGNWTIDATFEPEIDADSILNCYGDADMKFYASSFYWGLKKEWRYLSLGICGEFSPPMFVSGDWGLTFSFPSDMPKIRFDDDNLVVDTIKKVISGRAKLVVYDFEKGDSVFKGEVQHLFMSSNGVTGGMSLRVWRLETGMFGGLNVSNDGSYLRIRAGINWGFRTFVPLRAGIIFHFQWFNVADIPLTALPVISFGGGTDFNIRRFNIFLNLSGNTTQGAASFIIPGIVGGEKKQSALVAMGLGLRYKF